jgi:hypothetical protein
MRNRSNEINPFQYINKVETSQKIEVFMLQCVSCGKAKRSAISHKTTDSDVMRTHFEGWTAKGFENHESTLCPSCITPPEDKP